MLFDFKLREQKNDNDMEVDFVWNVKNLKEPVEYMSQDAYFDIAWESHQLLLSSILQGKHRHNINIQTAYELCSNICQCGKSKELYDRLHKELVDYFTDQSSLWVKMATSSNDDFLEYLNIIWIEKNDQMNQIGQIFCELDRGYVLKNTSYRSIADLGLSLFKKYIIDQPPVKKRLLSSLLRSIRHDRMDRMIDSELLGSIIQILQYFGIYQRDFEPCLLETMATYYEQVSKRLVAKLSVPDYLSYAKYQEEYEKSHQTYLLSSTREKLSEIVINKWIQENMEPLVSKGFHHMLDISDTQSINILYTTCTIQDLPLLCQSFISYIKNRGKIIFEKKHHENHPTMNSDIRLVKFILKFKSKLERIVNVTMNKNTTLLDAINNGFRLLLHHYELQMTRSLVKFVDLKLRVATTGAMEQNNTKKKKAENVQDICYQAMSLFRYLKDKDVFEICYRKSLANRLLLYVSHTDHENVMLEGLESACGPEFTKNMRSIVNDIGKSKDLYRKFISSKEHPTMNENCNILTLEKTNWSSTLVLKKEDSPPPLPQEIIAYLDSFSKFYRGNFINRSVHWVHSLGTATMTGEFPSGTKTIIASFKQAQILLQFNDTDQHPWTVEELATKLSMEKSTIESEIELMCQEKYPVLLRKESSDSTMDFNNNNAVLYQLNDQFECRENTISLFSNEATSVDEEQTQLDSGIEKLHLSNNRKQRTASTIARIMKAKRRLKHAELVTELRSQLPFSIDTRELKLAIEFVIDKQCIVREQAWIYRYIP
ncbi:Cullin family-domain-containing protein [Phascolomyces articulosus]|uniref:Cullin family-domain-containing protein n=1 Tax=Phascolomyces articulosus TaxID=60185 RepID=A0AAD5PIN5_9FUNG|nr:Cullin family-domain-containing protein [Phascolomyces articulosus]